MNVVDCFSTGLIFLPLIHKDRLFERHPMKHKRKPDSIEDGRLDKSVMTQHKNMAFEGRSRYELSESDMVEFGFEMMFKGRPQSLMVMVLMDHEFQLQF